MKLVFQNFESDLFISRERINVVRISNQELFSRCCISLKNGFSEDSCEPAILIEDPDSTKISSRDRLFYIGDLLEFDLNDRRISTLLLKKMEKDFVSEIDDYRQAEELNESIAEIVLSQLLQYSGEYCFSTEWCIEKYLKAFGLCVDLSDTEYSLFQKSLRIIGLAADLFPNKILCFVNLTSYLTKDQYESFINEAIAEQVAVLSYESFDKTEFTHLENGLFVDDFYLETCSYSE